MISEDWADAFLRSPKVYWGVLSLALVLFALTNLPWQLDDYDQAKQAFTSFEMVEEGDWLYQRTPNDRVATKPPLVGWTSAATYTVTRWWEGAWRLPSFAAALLMLALLSRVSRDAFGASAALIASSAFALNLFTPRLATLVRTDMPLALVIFCLGIQIWKKVSTSGTWSGRDRALAFALLTCAMLIKGPIVYAFLLPGLVIYQLWRRKGEAPSAWCGWWPWVLSLVFFGGWAAGGIKYAPGFYDVVVLKEFAGRFSETVHRPQPFYFYLPHLLHKFAPWSVLAIAALVLWFRREKPRWGTIAPGVSPGTVWLLAWSLGGLLVMSLVPSKRVDRIFPIIPPLCLLLAAQFAANGLAERVGPQWRKWCAIAVIFACLCSVAYSMQKVVIGYRSGDDTLVRFGGEVRALASAHGWAYESLRAKDEGLLLYLRRLHFVEPDAAIAAWREGKLNALVVPRDRLDEILPALPEARVELESATPTDANGRRYTLVARARH